MKPSPEVVISADGHVNESKEMWQRLPERYREMAPRTEKYFDGGLVINFSGLRVRVREFQDSATEDDLEREFRRDPGGGTDLDKRIAHLAGDGIHAEVVFPNLLLFHGLCEDSGFNAALARVYNDWVFEVFAPRAELFVPAAVIPIDEIEAAVGEAERCLKKGFRTLFMAASVPWRPYYSPEYEPLWRLAEEAGVPLNFHVFSGNVAFGADFASFYNISAEAFAEHKGRGLAPAAIERLSTTVIGMAAGMGPIVHLTGGGVLERHPGLRFVITESECGWLAWTLQAMDLMQRKRHLHLDRLPMKPSEYFLRQGAVTFSDDAVGMHNLAFTGSHCLMWGSDYPHDEGTYPHSETVRAAIRAQVAEQDARDLLCNNAARVYGFDPGRIAAAVRNRGDNR